MHTQLRRDPFARTTLMRETVDREYRRDCPWCGQVARFVYWWEPDSMYPQPSPRNAKAFCSVGCFEIHYS